MKHYHASFTRVGSQGVGDGWQAVNVSQELSPNAVASFTRFQNSNIYEPEFDTEDISAKTVMELTTDKSNAFLTYIKYGLQDQTGRPAMFADGYVFEMSEFVSDPANVLCVKKSNFRFDIESTKHGRSVLTSADSISLMDSRNMLSLDEDKYIKLVQCVFIALDAKTKATLHIICDCSEDTIRNTMFCIYSALPFAFRRNVSFSTYESQGSMQKTIIFDRKIKNNGDSYFVLQTGENSVITEAIAKRLERYEFMKSVPQNPSVDISRDFMIIENSLSRFGNSQSTSLDLNKLAYDTALYETNDDYLQNLSDDALCRRLNELLSVSVSQYTLLDEQINCTLGEIVERNIVLNDIVSEKLCKRLEKTDSEALIDTGNVYNANKIKQMTADEGASYLKAAYNDRKSKSFSQIKELLAQDIKGQDILRKLYSDLIAKEVPVDEEHILEFFEETKRLPFSAEIRKILSDLCHKYLTGKIKEFTSPASFMDESNTLIHKVFETEPRLENECLNLLKETYWKKFSWDEMNFDIPHLFEAVRIDGNLKSKLAFKCFAIMWRYFEQHDITKFCFELDDLFNSESASPSYDNKRDPISSADRRAITDKFIPECLKRKDSHGISELDLWLFFAKQNSNNPARFLIKNRIITQSKPGLDKIQFAIEESQFLQNLNNKNWFVEEINDYISDKAEGYEIAAELLKIIKEIDKQTKRSKVAADRVLKKENGEDVRSKVEGFLGGMFKRK